MRLTHYILIGALCIAPLGAMAAPATTPAIEAESLHLNWLDRSVQPGQNFFEYANGTWLKDNSIPPAYSRWGQFGILSKHNHEIIHQILEAAAQNTQAAAGSDAQKIGDFYASGMNEAAVNAAGVKPLQPELDRIAAISNKQELQAEIAHLQMLGVNVLFNFGPMQDFKNSSKVIGDAEQAGLGLPDRDYYLNQSAKFSAIREAYVSHIANMFILLGEPMYDASHNASEVMTMETNLAQASMTRERQRNPRAVYHVMTLKRLIKETPDFSWPTYFAAIGQPDLKSINLGQPLFFKAMNRELSRASLADWKAYLSWHLLNTFAPYLSKPFVDENFKMQSTLTGAKELLPRWQRVVNAENQALGFAVGKVYVEKEFPPSSKQAALEILHGVRAALNNDLASLAWMGKKTRLAAIQKLDMMGERIGYPDKWRDYSALTIDRGPYVLNVLRANEFESRRELAKIGKPVDRDEWFMTPQTVNAYYDPSMNNINFPAGILQPPFFDPNAPAAMNYGAIGAVMGHEMTHGFDDQGSRFDGKGNLKNWWSELDKHRFDERVKCVVKQFSGYTVDGDAHVKGKLVTGEAIADLGGLKLAWLAFHNSPAYANAPTIDGFTPDQQFFLGFAHVWAQNIRPEEARRLVVTDPHPPAMYRANGTLANLPQFQQAFDIRNGSPMVSKKRCAIW